MAKPGYGMIYAIVVILGLLVVVLLSRMLGSNESAPAAQAGAQRNEAVAEAAEARAEKDTKPTVAEDREAAPSAADKSDAAQTARPTAANVEEEERK